MEPERKTIAIIDDDFGVRQALERILSIAGFRVLAFSSAAAFLENSIPGEIGCAIVDVNLGNENGLDLAAHPAVVTAKLPIIFISGKADEAARARAIAMGCIQFLRKPFMPIELLDAIFRATQFSPSIP